MYSFATTVFAMGAGGAEGGGNVFAQFIPLILIFAIFWFLVIRPQQRKAKAHKLLVSELRKGDEVYTDGGIFGTVQKVADDIVTLEISPKVPIRIMRGRISEIVNKGKSGGAKKKSD